MAKKRIVMALGHNALGTNLPEQKAAVADRSGNRRFYSEWLAGCDRTQQRSAGWHDSYRNE